MKGNKIPSTISLCSGCEACANACPKDAISMKPDWRGFLYPKVDNSKCINCGLCQKACPTNSLPIKPYEFTEAFAFVDANAEMFYRASSGGAFGRLAQYIFEQQGVAYGCTMDSNYDVYFTRATNIEELRSMHGSKYVQARINDSFRQIKQDLKTGKKVLFGACPCQVAGLKHFLGGDHENLITMDLICHGVPSHSYFKAYVTKLLKEKPEFDRFAFRHKMREGDDEKVYAGWGHQPTDYYNQLFLWGKTYRGSCYKCPYAGGARQGDFTIGDFHTGDYITKQKYNVRGCSVVYVNTPKGKELKYIFKENSLFQELKSQEEAMGKDGGQMKHPSHNDLRTPLFYLAFRVLGIKGVERLYEIMHRKK